MDRRGKRVVYVSRCLLNQNLRFPGIATRAGAFEELVNLFLTNDIGIEQLPCLETLGWGGVSRTEYFHFQPLILRAADTRWEGPARIMTRLWLARFRRICRQWAKKVADGIQGFQEAGCSVVGAVVTNDSPTCGVTRTIDLTKAAGRLKRLGVGAADLENADLEGMREIIPRLFTSGPGIFTEGLIQETARRGLALEILGYDPWGDPEEEVKRIAQALHLEA
jgi:predicted secreted protein